MAQEPWEQLADIKASIVSCYIYYNAKLKEMTPVECVRWLRMHSDKQSTEINRLRQSEYEAREELRKAEKAAKIAEAIKEYLEE